MTFSKKAVTLGCLATLTMAVSLQGWSATRFSPDNQPLGSIAPIVLSDTDLRGNKTKGYRPWFENGSWQGDLVEYTVTSSGVLSSSVDFSGISPTNSGPNWSALVNFAATDADTYWDSDRKIITWNGNTQVPFRFAEADAGPGAGIGADNMLLLDPTAAEGASKLLDFVRGDRSNEYPEGTQMRLRTSILGDIIHSKPVYVGAPNANRTENDYTEWATLRNSRAPRVYVGANDGMLHVFDATSGDEVYAYVPSMLMGDLYKLKERPYDEHAYYVDGEMSVRDAYFNGDWHTVLAGSLGAGGKGFFVLDITDPNLSSESSNTGTDKKVLFEFNAAADSDLGDSFSRPVIGKLNDGDWYVVIGNGYNSVNGLAKLYLVNLNTLVVTKLSTSSGSPGNPNGLSSPSLLDTDRNGTADYAYAGDIDGNLWKFDLSASDTTDWEVAYGGNPLHPTAGSQAIIQAPQIARHPISGYLLYFATGRLFNDADIDDTSVQSLYGIWDSGNTPPDADDQSLLPQIWDGPKTYNYEDDEGSAARQTIAIYNVDAGTPDWETQHGWKVDFPAEGYRVLQPIQVRANRVKATVYKPSAEQQGKNWLIEALLSDGGPNPPASPIYDLNVDRILNTADLYDNNPEGVIEEWHVPMMWQQSDGIMSQVTIAYLADGVDTLFINYLQQSIAGACTEDCPNGFQGGHIDVETYDAAAVGGGSTEHTDRYDKLVDRVYVDFFDLNVPASEGDDTDDRESVTGHVEIDSTDTIGRDTEFVVLAANADISPGSTLQIGTKTWNVLDYQRQIHIGLTNWDPAVADTYPMDEDGASLVFTWGEIQDAGGNVSHNFDDLAIIEGGLHPTRPQCVIDRVTGDGDSVVTYNTLTKKGRWRNGALTLLLVKKSFFLTDPVNPAIAMVDIQEPFDLKPVVTTSKGEELTTTYDRNGDGDTDDDYETIGGLVLTKAVGGADLIWESTLFWHYGLLFDLQLGEFDRTPCYGEEGWAAAVTFDRRIDAVDAVLDALGYDTITSENLEEAIDACGVDEDTASYCLNLKVLEKLLERSKDYTREELDNVIVVKPNPDPLVIPGGATGAGLTGDGGDGAITEGPAYKPGRMSWTDVVK